jgi:hypothetical protein
MKLKLKDNNIDAYVAKFEELARQVLCPEHIVAIASGSVLGIHEENMVWFLFHERLTKLFDFMTYFCYSHSFWPGA